MAAPEARIMVGFATAGVVFGLHNIFTPSQANIRVGKEGDETIETARKQASWTEAAVVGGIYLLTKDPVPFIMGGAMIVALDWFTRVNNFTNPVSGSVIPNPFNVGVKEHEGPQVSDTGPDIYAVA